MKGLLAILLLLPGVLAYAADAPQAVPPTAAASRADVGSYVGIVTTVAPPALRAQLDLPAGVGVVVEAVDPDSPATRGGLAVHDVVTKLDDQWVINVPQFSVLVRLHRPGETVGLSVLRHGRPVVVPVQLGEKPLSILDAPVAGHALPALRPGRVSSVVTHADGSHQITLTTHGDDHRVTIADPSGTVIYDGPLDTDQDRERLPADVRAKVETLEKNWERFKQLRSGLPATEPAGGR